ncbi:transposase [Alkalihalobacillus sp. MEB130]|uniref:transposase n=1 Tax=Alkalihalobacillus sp. MEB130 TaxID=2976704 RepID=UPI0028DF0792|nr:transposase [Alkalihalobacillus sp. MEB130]MDT8860409.1 transposase [Alkalihalobacillus sp. MEB130]
MPRKKRSWHPGDSFHITTRGNRKSNIFLDQGDYRMYLSMLEETQQKYPFYLHSYCLMTNHVHLLLETITTHPQIFMKRLNSCYAMYFNRKYNVTGHLYQGRYHAEPVLGTYPLIALSRYIHLNPVRAYMVSLPEEYPWSSYLSFVSTKPRKNVTTETILQYFQDSPKENYRNYVMQEHIRWLQAKQ